MTRRLVAVLAPPVAVDGFPDEALRAAMVEDVYETVAALDLVEPVLALDADDPARDSLEAVTWPGTVLVHLPLPSLGVSRTRLALEALVATGADQVTVLAGDAPDLPGLLVGKLHRALGSADVAVLPGSDRHRGTTTRGFPQRRQCVVVVQVDGRRLSCEPVGQRRASGETDEAAVGAGQHSRVGRPERSVQLAHEQAGQVGRVACQDGDLIGASPDESVEGEPRAGGRA